MILGLVTKFNAGNVYLDIHASNWESVSYVQKQPPRFFIKTFALKNFAKFTGKQLCQNFFKIKLYKIS